MENDDVSCCGHRKIKIRSNNTDKVVLAISVVNSLQVDELWITYDSGKYLCNIPVHSIASVLGPGKASVLPMFHALTGCDTVSFLVVAVRRHGMCGTCLQT